jgi:hypothetical protein
MIPEIEGVGDTLQISFRQTKLKDVREENYGDGQCSTMSAHKDEWDAMRISRAALAAAVFFSRAHSARAGENREGHVGAAQV